MLKNESTEMYLETILRLSERSKAIREVDLADAMKVSKVSVCKAVKRLVEKQLVTYKDHRVALTKEGRTVALRRLRNILHRGEDLNAVVFQVFAVDRHLVLVTGEAV